MEELTCIISEAEDLHTRCLLLRHIPGISKLERKINSELKGLRKFQKSCKNVLENHLKCTNLTHLRAVLNAIENSPQVSSVHQSFFYESEFGDGMVTVDVVGTSGYKWIKIVARNPLAVHNSCKGEGQFGDKDINTLAKEYIMASDQNPINYESPDICFVFPRGMTECVHKSLKSMGVCPIGKILPDPDTMELLSEWKKLQTESDLRDITDLLTDFTIRCLTINLDITTLIVLTSNSTNANNDDDESRTDERSQLDVEQNDPELSELKEYLKGKQLVCCQTAYDNFQDILSTFGGFAERQRANELFQNVKVVPDDPAFYALELEESATVKTHSKIIFGTGETLQAITATANIAFVRAAANQGIKFSAYFHTSQGWFKAKGS